MAASSADAMNKLGAIEAVWEIVPRIHKSLKKYFGEEEYLSAYILMKECVALITEFLIENETGGKDYFRKLYLLDRKTALWWWFVQESSYHIYEASDEVVKIDILIALYFLAGKSSL